LAPIRPEEEDLARNAGPSNGKEMAMKTLGGLLRMSQKNQLGAKQFKTNKLAEFGFVLRFLPDQPLSASIAGRRQPKGATPHRRGAR
jgi:hypothetical protein